MSDRSLKTSLRRTMPPTLAACLVAWTSGARAQEAPLELARHGFLREAEEAARSGDHARAIERARRASELRATPSVSHFIAREHEALGQNIEALAQASACERGADADRGLHNREQLLRVCRALAARVAERVGRVVLRVTAPVPEGLTVRVAGTAVPTTLLGVPYVVEPGVVRVEAEAPGCDAVRRELTIAPGGVESLDLELSPSPPPPTPTVTLVPAAPIPQLPVVTPPAPVVHPPRSRVPWIAVGATFTTLAAAGFGVAGVSFALSRDAQAERDAACPSPCDVSLPGHAAALRHDQRYRDLLETTTWSLVVGASLTAGAALWWALARPSAAPVRPALSFAPGGVHMGLAATW